jgi:hypothetical protein
MKKPPMILVTLKYWLGNYKKSALELPSRECILDFLSQKLGSVQSSECYFNKKLGTLVLDIFNQDVHNILFDNNSNDAVASNQVFSNIFSGISDFSNRFKVLRVGRSFIFTVCNYGTIFTDQKPSLVNHVIIFDGEPEYQDASINGSNLFSFFRNLKNSIYNNIESVVFSTVILKAFKQHKFEGDPQFAV